MTKKKETTTEAEAAKVDEATKQAPEKKSNAVESIETTKTTKDTSDEKEALKTQENKESVGVPFDVAVSTMLNNGQAIKLPEWEGCWFYDQNLEKLFVLTKEGEILDTPFDEFKDRDDWIIAENSLTEEQIKLIDDFRINNGKTKELEESIEKEDSLEVLYCKPSSLSSSWLVVDEKVKVKDIKDHTYSHHSAQYDAEYLLENGKIFSVKEGSIIAKDGSQELEILKSNK